MTRLLYLSADPGVPVLGHKGASVHLRELAAAFAEAEVEVHIASPRIEPQGDALLAPAPLHSIPPVMAKLHNEHGLLAAVGEQARAVSSLCADLAVDAVYERFSLFTTAGVDAASKLGLPHVLEVNSPLRREAAQFRTLPHPSLAALFETRVFAGTNRVLAVSQPLIAALKKDGVPPGKLDFVPNGVAAERFPEPRRGSERFVAGFAGSLKAWHGIDTLVEALSCVPEVELEIVGEGPADSLLDSLSPARVWRPGPLPHHQVIERMVSWDVGLAPYSPLEGFWFSPLKILEYMAAGACPVASELGDAPALLGGTQRGLLVPPGDAGALAEVLRALVHDRGQALRRGQRARKWVAANRSWQLNAQRALTTLFDQRRGKVA